MGIVYLAERSFPIRRTVAIKVIKAGIATPKFIARFVSERQTLALMNHRNVAAVIDIGSTGGLPYLVMEYVPGEPITEYCDRHRLGIPERLDLFKQVCAGVQHAHQSGVIHRDIKPTNVLVAVEDGQAVPKIIDFGIAKALDRAAAKKSPVTLAGQILGTPAYMSPEQGEANGRRVDTRSDVYSLGVLLYELIAGALPFQSGDPALSTEGALASFREDEPRRPSARVKSLAAQKAAANRGTDTLTLSRRLSGDLDWITLRALEKDPERRYGSPSELADDIDRHLRVENVLARPPSATYRFSRFVRRHKAASGFAASLLVVLVVFAVTATTQAVRIDEESATAAAVTEFLISDLFDMPSGIGPRRDVRSEGELLDSGTQEVLEHLTDRPMLQARLLHTMGDVHRLTDRPRPARDLLEEARARLTGLLGSEHPDTLRCERSLGLTYMLTRELDKAEAIFLDVLSVRERELGEEHVDTLRSTSDLAYLYKATGRYDEASSLFEKAIKGLRDTLGEHHPETLISTGFLVGVYLEQDRLDELEPLLLELTRVMPDVLGDHHHETRAAFYNLACLHAERGEREIALEHLADAVERGFGYGLRTDPHLDSLREDPALDALLRKADFNSRDRWRTGVITGECFLMQNQRDEAEAVFLDVLGGVRRMQGYRNIEAQSALGWLALIYLEQRRYDEAETMIREWIDVRGIDTNSYITALWYLSLCRAGQGDRDEARELIERVLALSDPANVNAFVMAERAALFGDREETLRWLETVAEQGRGGWFHPSLDPCFDPFRGDPEIEALIEVIDAHGGKP
jgi:non-specific serine/threonine protein kinase/serine/threonine-protein kinase